MLLKSTTPASVFSISQCLITVGMRFCDFCAFLGLVFCHCSGWNEVTATWSYLEKCHARQCFQHFARLLGGWSVQGAMGLQWFKFRALGLRRDVKHGKHGFGRERHGRL